ncbi:uncharacterized protein LOC132185668 [Corylus avellana]|uniref:uncharacterized protein LOC132185668 n=1 Tax=Corylus avellana TaxID=13451 RepID=UPI00286B221D|nr:uncharacterized protein LOC132185668 [Corylus avellana]
MEKCGLSFQKDMGSPQTTRVCVKQVKQEAPEEWDESMPLPGDVIEGFAKDDSDELFVPAKAKSELSSQLGKIKQQEVIWVKVRRGDRAMKLRARIVQEKFSVLHKKFTIRAAEDDRHVAVLGDLTAEQCTELQEMNRRVVNVDCWGFNKRGVKYNWLMKVGSYMPDQNASIVSSILFMPLQNEHCIEPTTVRCMAWFSAAVSSGAPLVFVNIQTEQIEKINSTGRETSWCKQQNNTNVQVVQGIRLWFLPGVAEVCRELVPQQGEVRFGMDIKRTEEGFFYIYSVTKGLAADRAGLGQLREEAIATGYLLVISRLEGKSLTPSNACSDGLLHCCDRNEIRDTLTSAIAQMGIIQLHIMAWRNPTCPGATQSTAAAKLRPP